MKKLIISQSIMWAAAILMVAILDDTNFEILLLVVLATISILNLNKVKRDTHEQQRIAPALQRCSLINRYSNA